ncbi:MAG: class II aldolase/adducin family protein [Clostridia bacterium]|nr:class II aldolase/adducin family protein [Clostridia bacterium]
MIQSEYDIKKLMAETAHRLYDKQLVAAKHGNISYKLSDKEFLVTPRGVCKYRLTPDMIVKVDASGKKIGGGMYEPTSEAKLHILMYSLRPDIKAIVHAQPNVATAYAIKGVNVDNCVLPENKTYLGVVPAGSYNKTENTADETFKSVLANHCAFLFGGNSAFAVADTLDNAFDNIDACEYYCRMNAVGAAVDAMRGQFSQTKSGSCCCEGSKAPAATAGPVALSPENQRKVDEVTAKILAELYAN